MTDCASIERSIVPLPAHEFDGVIGLSTGRNGMGTIMAGFAVDVAMSPGKSVQRLILRVWAAVAGGAVAAGLNEPRIWVLGHLGQGTMTVDAVQSMFRGHDPAQALGLWARVALVAAFQRGWWPIVFLGVLVVEGAG